VSDSSDQLSPFSYVILILVGEGGAAPHDLRRMSSQGLRIYWSAAESRWYSEPKRLAQLGYLRASKQPGRTHDRTVYALTARGRRAVADWLATPSDFIRIQNEPAARLNGADLADSDEAVVAGLAAIRPQIEDQLRWLDRAEEIAAELPHRERYLRLNHRLSRRIMTAFLEWLDDVERELGKG
jgi:PadR family transcriptional regulator AphA